MTQAAEADAQPRITLWVYDFDKPLSLNPIPRIPVIFERVGLAIERELAQAMCLEDAALIAQRFARGRHCYVGRIADELVAYGWVTFDEEEIGEVNLTIRLKAGEAYIWHCATLPAYRGQRLYPALLTYIVGELRRLGLRRAWIGTDNNNPPSQVGAMLAGFLPIGDVIIARGAAARRVWLRARPAVSAQLIADARFALFGEYEETAYQAQ